MWRFHTFLSYCTKCQNSCKEQRLTPQEKYFIIWVRQSSVVHCSELLTVMNGKAVNGRNALRQSIFLIIGVVTLVKTWTEQALQVSCASWKVLCMPRNPANCGVFLHPPLVSNYGCFATELWKSFSVGAGNKSKRCIFRFWTCQFRHHLWCLNSFTPLMWWTLR